MSSLLASVISALMAAAPAGAPFVPTVERGELIVESGSGSLADRVDRVARAGGADSWAGYAVPEVAGGHQLCCWQETPTGATRWMRRHGGRPAAPGLCRVTDHDFSVITDNETSAGDTGEFVILVRLRRGEVETVRLASSNCALDMDGATLHWLGEVDPRQSVAWLERLVEVSDMDDSWEGAVTAIALHDEPSADDSLERIATGRFSPDAKEQAVFWMGEARGRSGYEALHRLTRQEQDEELRGHLAFALAQSPVEEAVDDMIRLARADRSSHVREQAVFWLAQKATRKAVGAISEAVEEDPETDVKRAAVFALSQLPDQEGVPLLIDLVRRSHNPAVREHALFWLGDSGDPRALDFIEEILGR